MRTNAHCRSVDREIRPDGNLKTVTLGSPCESAEAVTTSHALAGADQGQHAAAAAHGGGTFSDVASSHACTSPGTGCICLAVTGKRQLPILALDCLRIPEGDIAFAFDLVTGSGLCLAAAFGTGGGAERFTFARHDACAGRSGWIVSGFESCGARLFFWIAARHPALNKPGVGRDGNNTAAHAGARPGSTEPVERACARRSSFTSARRVAGHQSTGVGAAVAGGAQGLGRLAAAVTRGGGGGHSHTRASRASDLVAKNENERSLRSENGDGLTRAHSHTGAPRPSNGAGRAFFFAVGALES
jgi:hypothetical protein